MTPARYAVLGLAACAFLGALAVWLALRWYRDRTGFGGRSSHPGRIVASDTGVAAPVVLRDPSLGLRGRPDYVLEFEVAGRPCLVPLELKPGRRSRRVYQSDALQVAAYLIALRAVAEERAAPFGYLRYASRTFRVKLTQELEAEVRSVVRSIRDGRRAARVARSHEIVQRCLGCSLRDHCDEALG